MGGELYSGLSCLQKDILIPIPPLLLTKWPRKGWSGIIGLIPWFSSSPNNSGQSDHHLITFTSKKHVQTCKRSCLDIDIPHLRSSSVLAEIFHEYLTASLWKLHFDS